MNTIEAAIVLSARTELASRYGWMGRVYDGSIALNPDLEPCIKREVWDELRRWDSYNDMCAYVQNQENWRPGDSARTVQDRYTAQVSFAAK